MNISIQELEKAYAKSYESCLHPEYEVLIKKLYVAELTQEHMDYLCKMSSSKKHWPETRFTHLQVLLLNKTARNFDLKQFFYEQQKSTRRLWLKLFYIRGYALYANEQEMIPIVQKFQLLLINCHDYIDYEPILSVAGLPYLVTTYGYTCFKEALITAQTEYMNINPLSRGYFTFNEQLETVGLLSEEEMAERRLKKDEQYEQQRATKKQT